MINKPVSIITLTLLSLFLYPVVAVAEPIKKEKEINQCLKQALGFDQNPFILTKAIKKERVFKKQNANVEEVTDVIVDTDGDAEGGEVTEEIDLTKNLKAGMTIEGTTILEPDEPDEPVEVQKNLKRDPRWYVKRVIAPACWYQDTEDVRLMLDTILYAPKELHKVINSPGGGQVK